MHTTDMRWHIYTCTTTTRSRWFQSQLETEILHYTPGKIMLTSKEITIENIKIVLEIGYIQVIHIIKPLAI